MDYSLLIKKGSDDYLRAIFACDWLDDWDEDEIAVLEKTLIDIYDKDPKYLVFALSDYNLDPSGFNTIEDYLKFVREVTSFFGVSIDPEKLKGEKKGNLFRISYKSGVKTAAYEFKPDAEGWLDELFVDDFLNNQLFPAFKEDRVLYPLPPASDCIDFVFQYPEIIDFAYDSGLIPDDDFFE